MARSFMVNGKFQLPSLSPDCFCLALGYLLTQEEIDQLGDDAVHPNGKPLKVGDRIDGAFLTPRNTPYKLKAKVTKKRTTKHYDTCTIKDSGKPGYSSRLEALQSYYENPANEEISPFSCDMAELVSKSAIGKVFESWTHTETEVE